MYFFIMLFLVFYIYKRLGCFVFIHLGFALEPIRIFRGFFYFKVSAENL
jgi:hypothetical protein